MPLNIRTKTNRFYGILVSIYIIDHSHTIYNSILIDLEIDQNQHYEEEIVDLG